MIECNEIDQNINELLIAFQDCKKILNSDLRKLTEVLIAVKNCDFGKGVNYDTLVQEQYKDNPQNKEVIYPIGTYHSMSICVLSGTMIYGGFVFSAGTVRNIEVTTTNRTETIFTVTAGSQVYVEYLKETIDNG